MKQKFLAFLLFVVLLGLWSVTVRLRYAPNRLGQEASEEPTLPSFRKLSPYPKVTEIPSPSPAPTVNKTLKCPADMVQVDNFCIDRYEYPNKKGSIPMNYVDWYRAKELCEQQGKRLCSEDEWIRACHTSGEPGQYNRYSYGDKFVLSNCNVQNTKPVASGSYEKCKSYYGAFDMVGNVYEWVVPADSENPIYTLGGAFGEGAGASCYKAGAGYQPVYFQVHIGFRCCK
ncbi:MAG: SUMF1/EgtB/PvdO family nonheme iron enzyme [Planctomycetota bacterium]|nr:SUMF1/EgtB/PvdO family nonheme iron enzyme [Planctomycetota bacterium]